MKLINFQTKYLKNAHLFYKEYCHKDNTALLESAEIVDKSGVQSLSNSTSSKSKWFRSSCNAS